MMLYLFLAVFLLAGVLYAMRGQLRAPVLALEARLVSDWRVSYKWASMQLAAVFATGMVVLAEWPTVLVSTIQMWMSVPAEYRTILGPVGGVVVLGAITLARLWKQKHP